MSEVTTQQKQWNPQMVVGAYSFEQKLELAQKMARAKVFPGVEDEYKALAAIEIGEYLGMSPAEALMSVEFGVQGKPSISVHWQAAQLQKLGWKWDFVEHTASTCHMQFYPPDDREPFKMQFTASEAKAIQIYDKTQNNGKGGATLGNKWNYRSWMSDMLYAFVLRRVVKHYEPKILGGIAANEDQDAEEQMQMGVYEGHKPTKEEAQQAIGESFGESATGEHEEVKPLADDEVSERKVLLDEIRSDYTDIVYPLLNAKQRGDLGRKVFGSGDFAMLQTMSLENIKKAIGAWRSEVVRLKSDGIPAESDENAPRIDERGIPSPEIPDRGVKNAPETNLEGMDWREPLSAGLAALDEIIKDEGEGSKTAKHLGATLQEAADMLQTADVPDEEGQAMLQRIRAEVAALTGQDSFAL